MQSLFWIGLTFVAYTYFGYPILLWLLAKVRNRQLAETTPEEWPTVAVVVPVHNEKKHLQNKIENLRELDYPADKIKFYFSSDGSEDGSNEYIESLDDAFLFSYSPRQGKPSAINNAATQVKEDVIVFTDARQSIAPDAVKKLVSKLLVPGVGAVSGELSHYDSETQTGESVGLYWRYEKWLRKQETKIHSVAGVTGALYCIYREDFTVIPKDALLDDFEVPVKLLKSGKRVVLESGAMVFDAVQEDAELERVRKIRTLAGNFQSFSRHKWLFSPFSNPIWFQFLSHKVFRLVVPYALALMLVASFLADGWFYSLAALGQVVFYFMAFLGSKNEGLQSNKLVSVAVVFCQMNLAAVLGLKQYLTSSANVKWEKTA
ncbi:MAG: glycosyltransferase family 2 protein [Pseudomonadales bacterium]|nr:glycosyltransferase family 2 protein [Pseudomonadales bacterium]